MIHVESKRKSLVTIQKLYPGAFIVDVTSKGDEPWVMVSPFYPHGGIPVPFSEGVFAVSVEGVWQGLKVFEDEDVDFSKFENDTMKNLKRTVRKFGKPLGHRRGVNGIELLDYGTARRSIYLKTYGWMLENKAAHVIANLVAQAEQTEVVLLDYDTNGDIDNLKTPLSHAALVKRFIEKKHPHIQTITFAVSEAPALYEVVSKPVRAKSTPKVKAIDKPTKKPSTTKSKNAGKSKAAKSSVRKPKNGANQLELPI
ncbi:hypothetical protein J7E24_10035 [Hymenobacter sp. ISL-91]|uniref:DUF6939 family protein n=1 Tax=Hymenobacter sp. ISL-91 TaxID=2819151 RepID=UPI001BECA815|nr:hypothetical protein [Hymenobacter sp. ISL-91]MBT2558124.1 hypothetical protein [Hymenobacter sp. ISL-91]